MAAATLSARRPASSPFVVNRHPTGATVAQPGRVRPGSPGGPRPGAGWRV